MRGAFDVYFGVVSGTFDRWPDARHGGQMEDGVWLDAADQAGDGRAVGDVDFLDVDFGRFEIGLFPASVIEITEVIDADDCIAGSAKSLRGVRADKSGGAGDENRSIGHGVSLACRGEACLARGQGKNGITSGIVSIA